MAVILYKVTELYFYNKEFSYHLHARFFYL